jgi:hypothetical protein
LKWIHETLECTNPTLEDNIILDICPLSSDPCIKDMNEEEKNQAMYEAYEVTREMLKMIKLDIVVSCQCSIKLKTWRADCFSPK